jgi:hypothetical protein
MRRLIRFSIIFLIAVPTFAAKYAGEPFSLGVGARALAMGGATIAGPFDGSAGYWNPAGLNYLAGHNIMAMHAETFGSLLNHDFAAYCYHKNSAGTGIKAIGFYLYYLGGGGIKITDLDPESGRPFVVREESHGDFLLAGSVSGTIMNRFDIGATARIIYRDLATETGYGFTADVGALFQPSDFVRLGLVVTDLTSGIIHYSGGYTESILPTVKPGVMMWHSIKDFTGRLAMSGDIKFEGIKDAAQFWLGRLSLDTHYGLEVSYRGIMFGRVGFDIGDFTAGIGFDINRIKADFAYLQTSGLEETLRFSAGYQF